MVPARAVVLHGETARGAGRLPGGGHRLLPFGPAGIDPQAGRVQDAATAGGDGAGGDLVQGRGHRRDRKSTRLNSSHVAISYAVFCLKKKKEEKANQRTTRSN